MSQSLLDLRLEELREGEQLSRSLSLIALAAPLELVVVGGPSISVLRLLLKEEASEFLEVCAEFVHKNW